MNEFKEKRRKAAIDRKISKMMNVKATEPEEDWEKKNTASVETASVETACVEAEYDDLNKRLDTMDALVWAEEFVKMRKEQVEREQADKYSLSIEDYIGDESTMLGWFANAIMKGYDNGCRVGEENGLAMYKRKDDEVLRMKLENIINTHGESGNWNYSPYMYGMYNGLELARSILLDIEPNYREEPEQWLMYENQPVENVMQSEDDNYERAMKLVK